jgi:hypothetical protein
MSEQAENTDRELWRGPDEGNGSYYADSVHVTKGGGIGIDCGGCVIVKTPRGWHEAAEAIASLQGEVERLREMLGAAPSHRSSEQVGTCRHCGVALFMDSNRKDSGDGLRCWPECTAVDGFVEAMRKAIPDHQLNQGGEPA